LSGHAESARRYGGPRAHTARPFTGRNAIHRIADVISRVAQYEPRTVVLDGVEYEDQLQVVFVEGEWPANVVPDAATITTTIASRAIKERRWRPLPFDEDHLQLIFVLNAVENDGPRSYWRRER